MHPMHLQPTSISKCSGQVPGFEVENMLNHKDRRCWGGRKGDSPLLFVEFMCASIPEKIDLVYPNKAHYSVGDVLVFLDGEW